MTQVKQAESDDYLMLDRQICFPLYSAANAVVRAYRPLLDELDLTYLQYMALMVLWESSPLTVKEIGERLLLDSGTLTPLLKRLDAKGLVTRKRSAEDERARLIELTTEGKRLKRKAATIPRQVACSTGLTKTELKELKKLCRKALSNLNGI